MKDLLMSIEPFWHPVDGNMKIVACSNKTGHRFGDVSVDDGVLAPPSQQGTPGSHLYV